MPQYIVIKGQPACLAVNLHLLKQGAVSKKVTTIEGILERKCKMINVHQYDPIYNVYEDIGEHWADSVTGSLYKPDDGTCLTSYQMKMIV